MFMNAMIDYWFTIEPYVFVAITNQSVLLYNTLDGVILESDKVEVVELLQETLLKENCGVVLLTNKRYTQNNVNSFIHEIREKYMGDIIDVSLSKGKPVQLLSYFNFRKNNEIYKKHNFSSRKNVLDNLSEINLHVDSTTNVFKLICFLQSIRKNLTFNIIGDIRTVANCNEMLFFLNQLNSVKNIFSSYKNVPSIQPAYNNNFAYQISICFPIDVQQWMKAKEILFNQTLSVEYIFDVSSEEDCLEAEQFVTQFQIEKYRLKPVYTGSNIRFFEENVFLSKEDILSVHQTVKDIFSHQAINVYDYGKINIISNGDVYANLNHEVLGNIYVDNIYEIVQKEVSKGESWFRIRDQAPCSNCVYQWICPSPSDYEILIGRSNLCSVIKGN